MGKKRSAAGVNKNKKLLGGKLNNALRIKKIPKKLRQLLFYLFAGILVASSAGLLWNYTAVANHEEEYTTYYYFQEAELDYRVHMLPSNLFDEKMLGPGKAYITSLTDSIIVDFEYNYIGESEAELKGSYGATAILAAYTAQEEYLVWEKEYSLLSTKNFNVYSSDYSFYESFVIPFAEYLAFIEQAREETGFNPSELNLTVFGTINMEVETADGLVFENLEPNIVIPMKGSTFTVGGQLLEEREGGITQTRVVAAPISTGWSVFPAIITATAVILVFIRYFTIPAVEKVKPQNEEVPRIIKKHKERIVITANGVTEIPKGAITVYSFEELLKLADEVNKPILYPRPRSIDQSNHIFLIYTPEQVYAYGIINSRPASGLVESESQG